nr:RES family NAD+ phosphorylase [uncultured Sphingobacterium sp.]
MEEYDEILICKECVKDKRYKLLIEQINSVGTCTFCKNEGSIIDTSSSEFIQLTKALIRYHYSEWDYNTHYGGDRYPSLFHNEDSIFLNKENFISSNFDDELIDLITDFKVYEDYNKGVSIFAGYNNGLQNPLLYSIKKDLDFSILKIERKLKEENYFQFEEEITRILQIYLDTCSKHIRTGEAFYRARIGFRDKKRSLFGGFEGSMIYVPYSNSQIGAPPPYLAGVGRINRAGVSFLYCASDKYTAISEIRPHPGDFVSIGKFILNKDCLIFDLSERQFLNFYLSDEKLDGFKQLNTLTELLQKVIPPSERQGYNITQLIADCIRKLDFDGILFPSSVGEGENLVLFNPTNMDYTFDEAEVVEVSEVKYQYHQRDWKKDISDIE